jgi:glycosyltransferase involved in cell wall biosynthesis
MLDIYVSVIIPAFNAASTISQTLESLLAQNSSSWEAIVVNDGSIDETEVVVKKIIEKDDRIKIINQKNGGISVARNKGISLAKFEWLLFLDADDQVPPQYFERMTQAISLDQSLDFVHCGWVRIATDGTHLMETYAPDLTDLFPVLACYCPFAVHACIVRKKFVELAGKFDPSVRNCQDWDLWQRIARLGARFGAVKNVLVPYQMRSGSFSRNGDQFFKDAMKVLEQGHNPDPRVPFLTSEHVNGLPITKLPRRKLYLISWFAGYLIGQGKNINHLLVLTNGVIDRDLDPCLIAADIFESAIISTNESLAYWPTLWSCIEDEIKNFLKHLETQSQTFELARNSCSSLERMILQHTTIKEPLIIGATYAVSIEISEPIPDIMIPYQNAERLYCIVKMEDIDLGGIELPILNGLVSERVLKDAISNQFSWLVLGRFFEHHIYKKKAKNLQKVTSGELVFAFEELHNEIGWKLFLQQFWNRPDWPVEEFYNSVYIEEDNSGLKESIALHLTIEVSEELTDVTTDHDELFIDITVGGTSLGRFRMPVQNKIVTTQQLIVFITGTTNYKLCSACVREAPLGRPLIEPTSLRQRLRETAAKNIYSSLGMA